MSPHYCDLPLNCHQFEECNLIFERVLRDFKGKTGTGNLNTGRVSMQVSIFNAPPKEDATQNMVLMQRFFLQRFFLGTDS